MVRKIALLLTCAVLVLSMVACGGGETTPSSSTTTPTGGSTSDGTQKAWKQNLDTLNFDGREFIVTGGANWAPTKGLCLGTDKFVDQIEQCQTKYNFKLSFSQLPESAYHEILQTSALGGEYMADIWYSMTYNLPGYAKAGLVHSLDDYDIFDYTNPKWDTSILDFCSWEGKRYGFISDGTYDTYQNLGQGVFFNKDLFERESLESPYELYEKGEWTWDKMKELSIAATKDTDNDGEMDQWGVALHQDYYPFLTANGASIVVKNEDGTYSYGLGTTNAVEALEYFFEWNTMDCNAPWLGDWQSSRLNPFMEGKIAMLAYEWWIAYTYLKDGMEEDYGWVPFPMGPSGGDTYKTYRNSSNCWIMTSSVPEPDKVMMMYDLISDHEDWFNNTAVHENYCEDRVRDDETLEIFGEIWNMDPNEYDLSRNVSGLQQLCREAIDTAWGGEVAAKTAVDSIADAAQALIDDYYKK